MSNMSWKLFQRTTMFWDYYCYGNYHIFCFSRVNLWLLCFSGRKWKFSELWETKNSCQFKMYILWWKIKGSVVDCINMGVWNDNQLKSPDTTTLLLSCGCLRLKICYKVRYYNFQGTMTSQAQSWIIQLPPPHLHQTLQSAVFAVPYKWVTYLLQQFQMRHTKQKRKDSRVKTLTCPQKQLPWVYILSFHQLLHGQNKQLHGLTYAQISWRLGCFQENTKHTSH